MKIPDKFTKTRGVSKIGWAVILIPVLLLWVIVMTTSTPYTPEPKIAEPTNAEVFHKVKPIIELLLKSPSTAKYPCGANLDKESDGSYTLSSCVDSQNSFGAILRKNWTAQLKYLDNGGIDIMLVTIGGEVVYLKP